jgi:aspartate/methionine/tyrosine aminotransferase
MHFSRLTEVEPSATVAMNTRALYKKSQGIFVHNLSVGEPVIAPHQAVVARAEKAIREGKTQYTPVAGIPELRSAMTAWVNTAYQSRFSPEECVVTCGGKFGLYAVCQALVEPGVEAMVVAPYWVSYTSIVELFGGTTITAVASPETGFKLSLQLFKKTITSRTKIIFLNNAGNPTGSLYSREELAELLAFAKERGVIVISDEVYSGLTYDGREFVSCGSFLEHKDNVIIIQSASKHFAMTGWRVGFVLAPCDVVERVTLIQGQSTTGTSSVSQWAVLGALESAEVVQTQVRTIMEARRNHFVAVFSELFSPLTPPEAGLYAFVPLSSLGVQEKDDVAFCERVLEEGNIAMVPGSAFGYTGYVRFSFGGEEVVTEQALRALYTFLQTK